jgi:hypothetical protein
MAEIDSSVSKEETQVCRICGEEKPIGDFPPIPPSWQKRCPDHKPRRCRKCVYAIVKKQRAIPEVRQRIRATMRAHAAKPESKERRNAKARERYASDVSHRAKILDGVKAYNATNAGREAAKRRLRTYRIAHPVETAARRVMYRTILAGKFPKPDTFHCVVCGGQASEYHHHIGYALENALAVMPVCKPCHWSWESILPDAIA